MRLINADELISRYGSWYTEEGSEEGFIGTLKNIVDMMPTVDAAPVKRGKWIIYVVSPFDGEDVKCSECGQHGCAPYWDYCPHCGAKNDEVINENDI